MKELNAVEDQSKVELSMIEAEKTALAEALRSLQSQNCELKAKFELQQGTFSEVCFCHLISFLVQFKSFLDNTRQ